MTLIIRRSLSARRALAASVPFAVWCAILALVLVVASAPAAAQDNDDDNDNNAVEELKLATWIEDLARLVQPLRDQAPRNLHLRAGSMGGPGVIWEDDAGPLYEPWEIDDIEERLHERFGDHDHFATSVINGTHIAISAPVELRDQIVGYMNRFREMSAALSHVRVVPMTATRAGWNQLRAQYPDHVATDPAAFVRWLGERDDAIRVGAPADGQFRNGECITFEQLQARRYVRDVSLQTAIDSGAHDAVVGTWHTGWTLGCRPWVVRDGERVMIDVNGYVATPGDMRTRRTITGTEMHLPAQQVADINATLLAKPGSVYFVSTGPAPGSDVVTVFGISVSVVTRRPAELPGEHQVRGLLTRRYDVWELCLPVFNSWVRDVGVSDGERFLNDMDDESEPILYDDVRYILETLCPDWAIVGSREAYLHLPGSGYIEFVNTPKAHASLQRALTALQAARPRSLVTDVVAFRIGLDRLRQIPQLLPGGSGQVTPQIIDAALPADQRATARVIDTAVWHLEGQRVAQSLLHEWALVGDQDVQAQQGVAMTDPVVQIATSDGYTLGLMAMRSGDGWELLTGGTFASGREMDSARMQSGGDEPETIELPRIRTVPLGARSTASAGNWSSRMVGTTEDGDQVILLLTRTRLTSRD